MSLSDGYRVCMTCRFFDDFDSRCERFPPSIRTSTKDEDGDTHVHFDQPIIELEWATTCGEWQAASGCEEKETRMRLVEERMNEDPRA